LKREFRANLVITPLYGDVPEPSSHLDCIRLQVTSEGETPRGRPVGLPNGSAPSRRIELGCSDAAGWHFVDFSNASRSASSFEGDAVRIATQDDDADREELLIPVDYSIFTFVVERKGMDWSPSSHLIETNDSSIG
jgi:hypothetical protein